MPKIANHIWLGAIFALSGCTQPSLYVAHNTVVGVNAAVNTQRTSGSLIVGYDRDFITLIPKSVDPPEEQNQQNDGAKEAMSAISCSKLEVKNIWLSEFKEYLATGQAAKLYAQKVAQGNADVFSCFNEKPDSTPQG
ncbi:MAG: hypothetical protein KDC45_06790 [Bacteroidetes bacterium]|nr:hypothetical protein [Bacteroidota bacterium]